MLKRFTLLASSLLAAFSIAAQETTTTASASFTTEDGGKTLVVKGKGDLTTLTTSITTTVFTNTAVGNVFVKNGEAYVSVTQGSDFSSSETYYKVNVVEPTAIDNTDANPFLSNKTYVTSSNEIITSWNETKLSEQPLYYCVKNNSDNGITWLRSDATVVNADDAYEADGIYAVKASSEKYDIRFYVDGGTNDKYYLQIKGDELDAYLNKYTEFTAEQTIYASTDGTNFTKIEAGSTAVYNSNATYYIVESSTFSAYENTSTFSTNEWIEDKTSEEKLFKDLLNDKILEGAENDANNGVTTNFETVRFENEDRSTSLIINDDIVHAILFPTKDSYKKKNNSIVTLDLGQATIENLTSNAFIRKDNNNQLANMANLTLPLTKTTSVYNESSKKNEDKMVLPTQVLEHYSNYTPGKGSANLVTVTIPEGYDRLATMAFYSNAQITTFNLPSSLKLIGESAFELCGALTSITLNDGLENIGKRAFVSTNLTKISFPHSLRIINDAAFADLRIEDLKFNAGLYYIGNTAFGLNNAMKLNTIQIPASVKFIGACAFYGREYQDVYFLGENAPIMPMGGSVYINNADGGNTAFPANTLNGNNGFDAGTGQAPTVTNMMDDAKNGYANRENYKNNGYYFAILHFPTGLTDEQRAKYTDITRVYKTHRDTKGNFYYAQSSENPDSYDTVGKETETLTFGTCTAYKTVDYGYEDTYLGSQYIWPSQSQWNRSYVVNSLGYNWDGETKYRPTLSTEDKEVLAYAGYKLATDEHPSTEDGYYTEDYLQMIAHMGTRQFVLTNADTNQDEKPEEEPVYPISMKGSNWWTICVPFSMTKAQVDKVFGTGTHVCRFSSVTRTDDGKGNRSITLRFQNDVYATKWTRDAKTLAYNKESGSPADNDIVIYSHEAYMIYPTKSSEDANGMYNIKDYKLETGSPLPTIIKANANETENADHTEYRFVGNYVTEVSTGTATNADEGVATADFKEVTIPQYSYIYAKKKNDAAYKFWFFTGTQMAWSPNKCVVQATKRDGGLTDYNNFFGGNANSTKVTQMSLFGEETDGGTTGINEEITIIAGEGDNAQRVYNLNGQMIGGNNAKPKGIYIKGGKKFMVK